MPILNNITLSIGRTPLIKLNKIREGLHGNIAVKMESMNPLGSVKDRIAASMVNEAQKEGLIKPGVTNLIEPTSGNTGIGLAFVAATYGYKLTLTMPDTMSTERRKLLTHLGAELILTPGAEGMQGAVNKANELLKERSNSHMLQQFDNPANPKIHRETTAEEIWRDTEGKIDIFIAGVGTGGTITGVGQVLKEHKPSIKIIAVEPKDSPLISQKLAGIPLKPAPHKIQGLGANFIPSILDISLLDEVITISNEDALNTSKQLSLKEGILAGISSGANVKAALEVASRPENKDKLIVTVIPSTGERYISTLLFAEPEVMVK